MNRGTLKAHAKQQLAGNWQWAVLLSLLTALVSGILGGLTYGIGTFIAAMLWVGYAYSFLDLTAGKQETNYFTAMFSGFTHNRFVPVLLTYLLTMMFTVLWLLLLIIPGIVKALAYSQAFYITKDLVEAGHDVQPTEAITKSRQLMDGHKWEYFVLQLSFLGWAILCCCTLGIGFLWLNPYIQTTNALYYRRLAGDKFRSTKTTAKTVGINGDASQTSAQ